jgi:SulP family sulfate permease
VPKHPHHNHHNNRSKDKLNNGGKGEDPEAVTEASSLLHGALSEDDALTEEDHQYLLDFSGSFVLQSLDLALIFAENTLIAWEDPLLLDDYKLTGGGVGEHLRWDFKWDAQTPSSVITDSILSPSRSTLILTGEEDEKEVVTKALSNLCVGRVIEKHEVDLLFSKLTRESYRKDEFIWKQNDASNSAKLLISGMLVAVLENEADTSEIIFSGNLIGELGLVQGTPRLSSVKCISEEGAILYSLSREAYEDLLRTAPQVARFIDLTCIQYLANRVQHVSNRIFETRCLPI